MKNYRKFLLGLLLMDFLAIGFVLYYDFQRKVPDDIKLVVGRESEFNFSVPAFAYISDEKVDLAKPFSMKTDNGGEYDFNVKLFGVIPVKTVEVMGVKEKEVIPCGKI